MKQQVTLEQLKELKGKAAMRYVDWCIEKEQNFAWGPTIGIMIEFLDEQMDMSISIERTNEGWLLYEDPTGSLEDKELCDALWQAVKETLNKTLCTCGKDAIATCEIAVSLECGTPTCREDHICHYHAHD